MVYSDMIKLYVLFFIEMTFIYYKYEGNALVDYFLELL
jgi:hypothetical protein